MRIGNRVIDVDHPPYLIAEIGVNHDGSRDKALTLVDAARDAGVDAVKFQLFEASRLLGRDAQLAGYQKRAGGSEPHAMLAGLELPLDRMKTVVDHVQAADLHAIVSIFSVELVASAREIAFDAYKVASTDVINRPLIEAMMRTHLPLLVSTGAASLDEVRNATDWLGDHPHILMHCVSSYPTPDEDAALGGRVAMLAVNPHSLGYSDHTTSLDTGGLAVAGGACVLEKHLTLDRSAPGPDHAASLDPEELREYVRLARRAWTMRGPIVKTVLDRERDVRAVSRQSLTATRDLPAGHVLTREDLTVKRPGTGLSPACLNEVEGRTLACPIEADTPLMAEHVA